MPATTTREHPILFSAPMVRALLDGRKTQTRRVVTPVPHPDTNHWWPDGNGRQTGKWMATRPSVTGGTAQCWGWAPCPYGMPGERLWVREAWRVGANLDALPGSAISAGRRGRIEYPATPDAESWANRGRFRSSRFMPRWASRLTLEIADVRVQRVQDISEDDATAEGVEWDVWDQCAVTRNYAKPDDWFQMWSEDMANYVPIERLSTESFRSLWDSINAKRGYGWDANPWVWALTFRRIDA